MRYHITRSDHHITYLRVTTKDLVDVFAYQPPPDERGNLVSAINVKCRDQHSAMLNALLNQR